MRTHHYRPNTSRNADRLVTFHQQMADFARGERLRALRDERHLSQEDAAHEIGVSTKALRAWEKGGKIKWENAKSAGALYEVDPESLVSRDVGSIPTVMGAENDNSQLDRIEADVAATRVELATLSTQLADLQKSLRRKPDTAASKTRTRKGN